MATSEHTRISGNIHSDKLPGGSLIAGVLDRQLMTWSDRGGASGYIGDQWSQVCSTDMENWVGTKLALPDQTTPAVHHIVRLDDDQRIAVQAGRHKLRNPDFIVHATDADRSSVLVAVDAKFAIDTIKPIQVSKESLRALLDLENGLALQAVESTVQDSLSDSYETADGLFISPYSPLTDYYWSRVTEGNNARACASQIKLRPAPVDQMFGSLPEFGSVLKLAALDQIPGVNADHDIMSALYYFRVACACTWLWRETHAPLLSLEKTIDVDYEHMDRTIEHLSVKVETAYELVQRWENDIRLAQKRRKTVNDMARMPIRMGEIRRLVSNEGLGDDPKLVRLVRGALERQFRTRLLQETGVIPAEPLGDFASTLEMVAATTYNLRPEMLEHAQVVIEEIAETAARADRDGENEPTV